ncbi:MAG: hypothetical protein IPK25_15895 [Saprospiraceae bacterium]|nr:hypothetical protein [Saprospiraceae bacterium]
MLIGLLPVKCRSGKSNTLRLGGGSLFEISGTNLMEYGIYNTYPFTIDTNANRVYTANGQRDDAIFDMGSITNHGSIEITELQDTLSYGIVNIYPFNNYGNIIMSDMGSGARVGGRGI